MNNATFLTVKDLSDYLKIKPSTLYSWANQGKIPRYKVNGLLRFKKEEIDFWIASLRDQKPPVSLPSFKRRNFRDADLLVASAKKEVYNIPHGKPDQIKLSGRRSDGTL
jgi:excisionase family DNA binding protein